MPSLLHDPKVRDATRARINKLTPDTPRKWGKMTVDQMLWHCNSGIDAALGKTEHEEVRMPLPRFMMKFIVLNLPWPKGAPTHPDWIAGERRNFGAEKARALALLDEFTNKGLDWTGWGPSPAFGKMNGAEWTQLQAKHWDHHLRQFGV